MTYINRIMRNKPTICKLLLPGLLLACFSTAVLSADYKNRVVKEMESSKPSYLKRTTAQWEKQGRVVGELKYTPKAFTIDIYPAGTAKSVDSKPLKTITPNVNLTVYDTGWLAIGSYDIVFKSEGYVDQVISNIKINPYTDCVINIIFGQIEYKR